MRLDFYFNGKSLNASSRANITYRFGFIALDLLSLVTEDAGVFTCVVSSATGSAESSATLSVIRKLNLTLARAFFLITDTLNKIFNNNFSSANS